jgi:nucleotide-binding universal stress UspA family protein
VLAVKTIVVGYDGTKHSSRALDRAVALAQTFGSSLVVVSVGDALLAAAAGAGMGVGPVPVAPVGPEDFELAQKQLQAAGESIAGSRVDAEYVAEVGVPSERIVAVADERHADLIVVGTREAGFLERLLEGSVSRDVSRRAHCHVLVVR